jgi:hypothetical protein
MGCYFSTGDSDWLWDSPPGQSAADIEAVFDSLTRVFGVQRIYWRGLQTDLVLDSCLVRPENLQLAQFYEWERHLTREVATSRLAIEAAHRRGLTIWGWTALFDHGGQAEADAAKGHGPSPIEDRLRSDHPEWVPSDRYGIRRQAGPLEFAYPEVRAALARQIADRVVQDGYDGVAFYTYVEYFHTRFEEEFGYNDIVAEEFVRRYGQDPRQGPFDRFAWHRLRGEYVTAFLHELKGRLKAAGRQLGVALDPQDTHCPGPWLCATRDLAPAGRIYLDWERWVREGIVDEIMVYCNGPQERALNEVFAVTRGTPCAVSAIYAAEPFPPHLQHFTREGLRRVMVSSVHAIEAGLAEDQPLAALQSPEPLARMRVLQQLADGSLQAELPALLTALRDPHVLVRRQALAALAARGGAEAVPAIEEALRDPEHSVRCAAAAALGRVHGTASVGRLFEAVAQHGNFQLEETIVGTLAGLPDERTADLLAGARAPEAAVRRVAVYTLGRGRVRPEAQPVLVQALRDEDPYVRWSAAYALAYFAGHPDTVAALLAALQDPHPTVRSRAALSLSSGAGSHSRWITTRQWQVFEALSAAFRRYGDAYQGPDADWGYCTPGGALLAFGPRGREVIDECLAQRRDLHLADAAWRVLYAPQTGQAYHRLTEEEAEKTYRLHPRLAPQPSVPPAPPAEPELMPYLQQSFDTFPLAVDKEVGDLLGEAGTWRGFGAVSPMPVVQDRLRWGGQGAAVRLTRGPAGAAHVLSGLRADDRLSSEWTRVAVRLYRDSDTASFCVHWQDSGTGAYPVGTYISPDGAISLWSTDTWVATGLHLPARSWERHHGPAAHRTTVQLPRLLAPGTRRRGGVRRRRRGLGPQPGVPALIRLPRRSWSDRG